MSFGAAVMAERSRRELSRADLASEIGVSREQISRVERGVQLGSVSLVVRLAVALDIDLNVLKGSHSKDSLHALDAEAA